MNQIHFSYLIYSIVPLFLAHLLASAATSLTATGDAGLPRLMGRSGRKAQKINAWKNRWELLCKTAHVLLMFCEMAIFILFYLALADLPFLALIAGLLLLSMPCMLLVRIVPHVLSESYADRISLATLPTIVFLTRLLYPFMAPLQFLEDRLLHHAMSASDEEDHPSAEDEIKSLIEETDEEDLEEEEREIIRSVFEFGETVVREIMVPRIEIAGLKDHLSVRECIEQVKESRYSRFPVYHENLDDVLGMVHVKDLLRLCACEEGETPIRKLVKKVDFVPETMPINDLMQRMKKNRSQMVLVVDEYGGTEGLVTMEDIIEELVGEIEDEYDAAKQDIRRRPDGSFLVKARTPICDLNNELGLHLPESEEYDSLGGHIFAQLGHIPVVGDTLDIPGYQLRIHSATPRKILLVHLIPNPKTDEASKGEK
jgi:putative hemolysin